MEAFAKEMEEKGLAKPKVSLQFELNPSGITQLVKAEAAVEETIIVEEEEEVDDEDEEANATDTTAEDEKMDEGDAKEEEEDKKEEEVTEGDAARDEKEMDDKSNETMAEAPKIKKKKTITVQKVSYNLAFVQFYYHVICMRG